MAITLALKDTESVQNPKSKSELDIVHHLPLCDLCRVVGVLLLRDRWVDSIRVDCDLQRHITDEADVQEKRTNRDNFNQ
jgi:hypothetical protein